MGVRKEYPGPNTNPSHISQLKKRDIPELERQGADIQSKVVRRSKALIEKS
jgi:hypothetical protein